jgi:hypothetical protein
MALTLSPESDMTGSSEMRTGVRTIGLVAVLIAGLMAALAFGRSTWDIRMTPEGMSGLLLVGLLVVWVGTSLVLPGRRRA